MAKSHVVQYFLEVEHQYLEMVENLKEFEKLSSENKISYEDFEQMLRETEIIKTNYERLSYVMFLLNKPQRKSKKLDRIAESWYKALRTASKEAIIDENRDALVFIKELIKKGEIGSES